MLPDITTAGSRPRKSRRSALDVGCFVAFVAPFVIFGLFFGFVLGWAPADDKHLPNAVSVTLGFLSSALAAVVLWQWVKWVWKKKWTRPLPATSPEQAGTAESSKAEPTELRPKKHAIQEPAASPSIPASAPVTFQREERRPHPILPSLQITKQIYSAASKEAALAFLRTKTVSEPFFYIEVDTPAGRFGIDNAARIYDKDGRFVEAESEPQVEPEHEPRKMDYDAETLRMKSALVNALDHGDRRVPQSIIAGGESSLRSLRIIIEDASADFFVRRMAVWWGREFNDAGFKAFLKKRFVDGKDKAKLFQRADSSRSEIARAEAGLYVASAEDALSPTWKGVGIKQDTSPELNLKDWKSSGEPEAWVQRHLRGWNHNDWLGLLGSLRKSRYWPMDETAVGRHLEMLRESAHATQEREMEISETMIWQNGWCLVQNNEKDNEAEFAMVCAVIEEARQRKELEGWRVGYELTCWHKPQEKIYPYQVLVGVSRTMKDGYGSEMNQVLKQIIDKCENMPDKMNPSAFRLYVATYKPTLTKRKVYVALE